MLLPHCRTGEVMRVDMPPVAVERTFTDGRSNVRVRLADTLGIGSKFSTS